MNQTGACEAQGETKLSELMGRMSDMCICLSDNRMNLNSLSDRLIGSCPECPTDSAKAPVREGAIGQIENEVDKLKYQVDEIRDAVNRLISSGVV